MYEYQATVHRVIDGDTVILNVDLGFSTYRRVTVRLKDVMAPELSEEFGLEAKAKLVSLLLTELTIKTFKDKTEKYGRYLGVIGNVNTLMQDWIDELQSSVLGVGQPTA